LPEETSQLDHLTQRAARGGAIVLVGRIALRALGLGIQLLLSNFLGARSYGLYSLGINVLHWLQHVSQLGLVNGVVRFVSMYQSDGDTPRIKGTILGSLVLAALVSVLLAVVLWAGAQHLCDRYFHEPELAPYLRFLAFGLPFTVLLLLCQGVLRGFQRMGAMEGLLLFRTFLQFLLVACLCLVGLAIGGAVAAFVVSAAIAFVFGLYLINRIQSGLFSDFKLDLLRLLRFSIPVLFTGLSYTLLARLDLLLIGYYMDASDAGYYRAAITVATQVTLMLSVMNTVFAPMISQLHHRGEHQELRQLYKTVTRWSLASALPICLVLVTLSRPILGLFGSDFSAGVPALTILALTQTATVAMGSVGFLLQMTGKQDWVLVNSVIAAVTNVVLNVLLIPRWGISGAAVATGLSFALNQFLAMAQVWIFLRFHPWTMAYAAIFLASGGALIIHLLIPASVMIWPLRALIMVGTYSVIFMLRGLDPGDRLVLRAFSDKIRRLAK
jgi:O-antigen/teichoic acid export membrane protein